MADEKLTKLTVNLTPYAYSALLEAAKTTGDTRTDTVNRALHLYAFIVKQQGDGWSPAMVSEDGTVKGYRLE